MSSTCPPRGGAGSQRRPWGSILWNLRGCLSEQRLTHILETKDQRRWWGWCWGSLLRNIEGDSGVVGWMEQLSWFMKTLFTEERLSNRLSDAPDVRSPHLILYLGPKLNTPIRSDGYFLHLSKTFFSEERFRKVNSANQIEKKFSIELEIV